MVGPHLGGKKLVQLLLCSGYQEFFPPPTCLGSRLNTALAVYNNYLYVFTRGNRTPGSRVATPVATRHSEAK